MSGTTSKEPKIRTKGNKAVEEIYGLIGDKAGLFQILFKMMNTAEEVIKEKQKEHPDHKKKVNDAFRYLKPSDIFHRFSANKMLYGKHCEEIIERAIFSPKMLKYGTDAEVLAVLSIASLVAPPDSDHTHVYFTLFKKLFRDQYERLAYRMGADLISHESYPGRADEIITYLKKKLITWRDCREESKKEQLSLFS